MGQSKMPITKEKQLNFGGPHNKFKMSQNRVFCKVRKTQHQNPGFGTKPGEVKSKPAKKYISLQGGETQNCTFFCGKLSFILF
jgi:hypothetical protein